MFHVPSSGVYISQVIRFARVCSHVEDFNARNKCSTAKLFKQGYRYISLGRLFPSSIAEGSPKIRDELKHVTVLHLHTA